MEEDRTAMPQTLATIQPTRPPLTREPDLLRRGTDRLRSKVAPRGVMLPGLRHGRVCDPRLGSRSGGRITGISYFQI
jgi:hypothetical protein